MGFMQGLDMKSIKKHPSLVPLYLVLGAGCLTAVIYTARLALKNPDVTWSPKTKPEPWNDYADKRYKLYDAAKGITKLERPNSIWD